MHSVYYTRKARATYLFVEDGLGLTTVTALLAVVTALSLCENGVLALLVLGHFVRSKRCF